jgi:hypothetical protein
MPAGEAIIIRGIGIRRRIEYRIPWIRGELIYEKRISARAVWISRISGTGTRASIPLPRLLREALRKV